VVFDAAGVEGVARREREDGDPPEIGSQIRDGRVVVQVVTTDGEFPRCDRRHEELGPRVVACL
jgi:hypothetical protein